MKNKLLLKNRQGGNVVTYILIAIFLSGLLVAALSQGSKKSANTTHLDQDANYLRSDLTVIHSAIDECVQVFTSPVDVDGNGTIDTTDNPNAPFPLYDDLSSGGVGVDFSVIKCPGAASTQQALFTGPTDNRLKILTDTSTYTATYVSDATEGVYIKIINNYSDALWKEIISRVNDKTSICSAAVVVDAGDCAGSCLYYWILRRSTSAIGVEAGCP